MTVSIEADVVFNTDPELCCDIYLPERTPPRGVALLVHAGGWRLGSRKAMTDAATSLAERGWAAVAPQYRLLDEARWPAQIEDVKRAIRWVRSARVRFGDACDRLAVVGYSAGAHLSMLAGATGGTSTFAIPGADPDPRERPDAVIEFFGIIRIDEVDAMTLDVDAEGAKAASPIDQLTGDFPPTLIFNGTSDAMVSHEQALELFHALNDLGVPIDLRLYAGLTHDFQRLPEIHDLIADDMVNFLERHLVLGEEVEAVLAERREFWAAREEERVTRHSANV